MMDVACQSEGMKVLTDRRKDVRKNGRKIDRWIDERTDGGKEGGDDGRRSRREAPRTSCGGPGCYPRKIFQNINAILAILDIFSACKIRIN